MKKLLFLFLLVSVGCKIAPLATLSGDADRLTAFMNMCERDIRRTRQVVLEHDMVKNLSHLQFMNSGGSKFYLLERESITSMIRAVTEGVYSDYILINKKGTVIYNMSSSELFNKNVKSHLKNSPLNESFNRRSGDIHLQVAHFSGITGTPHLFISCVVKGGDSFPGIIVLQVDMSKILELIDDDTLILDRRGRYILSRKNGFTEMNRAEGVQPGTFNAGPAVDEISKKRGRPFTYKNLEWILLSR